MRAIRCFALLAILAFASTQPVHAHSDMGLLEDPIALSDIALRLHDGTETTLHRLTAGKVTALQLIFTECTTVCPIQGATFGFLAEDLADGDLPFQLFSLSIDANYDTPSDLADWRARHYDGPGWILGVTDFFSTHAFVEEIMASKFGGLIDENPAPSVEGARPSEDNHHGSIVVFIGPGSNVIYRTFNFPEPETLREILNDLQSDA